MPRVNENERRLITAFGIVIFLAANVFGYLLYSDQMKLLTTQKSKYSKELAELEVAKSQAGEADIRENWMAQHFKTYPSDEFRETYLDGLVNSDLTAGLDVDLTKPSVLPTDFTGEFCVRSKFRINVKGPWSDVYKFIYRLQNPEEFRFVPQISMVPKKAESDDSISVVEVQVTIEKWWQKPDSMPETVEPVLAGEPAPDGTGNAPAIKDSGAPTSPNDTTPPAAPAPATPTPAPATAPADNNSPKPNP